MKWLYRVLTVFVFLSFINIAVAQENQELRRSNLSTIKILSSDVDNISLYLTDKESKVYRIAHLNQKDAQTILDRFSNGSPLIINTKNVKQRGYVDVTDWK